MNMLWQKFTGPKFFISKYYALLEDVNFFSMLANRMGTT